MKTIINNTEVVFAEVFDATMTFGPAFSKFARENPGAYIFAVDLAATDDMANILIEANKTMKVYFIDHHMPEVVKTPQDEKYMKNLERMRSVGVKTIVQTRTQAPGCLMLVEEYFSKVSPKIVFADQDADGLLAAMGLCEVTYPGMMEDAAILDGPRGSGAKPTEIASLYMWALASLPTFDPSRPEVFQKYWLSLAEDFIRFVQGGEKAKKELEERAKEYEKTVERANAVPLVKTCGDRLVIAALTESGERVDLGTLVRRMDVAPAKVTAVVKTMGPIVSAGFKEQYSIAVVKQYQGEIDLREAVSGLASDPKTGVISNTPFLLHVSREIFEGLVLPWLKTKLEA